MLINPDLTVKKAGGYIIQLLPAAHGYEEVISKLEKNIGNIKPVTALLEEGNDIEQIIRKALEGFEVEVLEETSVGYVCNCSRERTEKVLRSLNEEELEKLAKDEQTEVNCRFCGTKYTFSSEEIINLKKNKKN